jgi:spore germination protein GerM
MRQIPSRARPEEDLLAVMKSLCAGPTISGAVSALPRGTRPLAAFYNPSERSVVLDFSTELVTNHPGGAASEVATLTSILRTVALNFPEADRCWILVDGAQVETLAGHLTLDRPFTPRRWL